MGTFYDGHGLRQLGSRNVGARHKHGAGSAHCADGSVTFRAFEAMLSTDAENFVDAQAPSSPSAAVAPAVDEEPDLWLEDLVAELQDDWMSKSMGKSSIAASEDVPL